MTGSNLVIDPVSSKGERKEFVDLGRRFAARVPNNVPQLRSELLELIDPDRNPFFRHARVQLFIARRGGEPVGRISAHIDELALKIPAAQGMGPGTGMFGYFDAADETVARALLATAEEWLRDQGMDRALGPISLSVWEEPGLLVRGQEHRPRIMMGHHPAHYHAWIESAGYVPAKRLLTYALDIRGEFPPLIQRIVQSGERNGRIRIRRVDKNQWNRDAGIILTILNDAWSDNWGFVPFTPEEVAYAGKRLKPIIHEPLNMIAELDGRPVAFMLTFPDINGVLRDIGGRLLPFGWLRLLRWLRKPKGADMRVPLMGVLKELQNSRLASQLAFMMIEKSRQSAIGDFGTQHAEFGWVLDDNQGMVAIAEAIEAGINREYVIFEKPL